MSTKEKTPNYSAEQIAVLVAAAPLNLEKAKEIAAQIGKPYRSVIAKAKTEGIEYVAAAPAKKRVGGTTKADMVSKLADFTGQKLEGLEKAPALALANLVAYFETLDSEDGE